MTEPRPSAGAQRPRVSVALATFEGAAYLPEQLASLSAQTRPPDELVVVDDGSRDGTREICEAFAADAPFAVSVRGNEGNLGPARNFERALAACAGDHVFLCDQDDVWRPEKIRTMLDAFAERPRALLGIHDLRYCDSNLQPLGQTKLDRIRRLGGTSENYVTGMATAVRRSLLDVALPMPAPELYTHDDWLHTCASVLEGKFVVERVLADYRRHEAAVTDREVQNATGRGARLERLKGILRPTPPDQLVLDARRWTVVRDWAVERRDRIVASGAASAATVDRAIERYDGWIRFARARVELLRTPPPYRIHRIAGHLIRGDYAPFRGARSALKDLVQPRSR